MKTGPKIVIIILCVLKLGAVSEGAPKPYAIRAGKILTMVLAEDSDPSRRVINHGVILISNRKIEAIGPASELKVPENYTVIDASDRWVMPGIIEAHTHIAIEGGFNDMVTTINPELKIYECVNLEDIAAEKAVRGGNHHSCPAGQRNKPCRIYRYRQARLCAPCRSDCS